MLRFVLVFSFFFLKAGSSKFIRGDGASWIFELESIPRLVSAGRIPSIRTFLSSKNPLSNPIGTIEPQKVNEMK